MSLLQAKHATVGGCELHFLEGGKAGAPAVILLHGRSFSAATWQELGTLQILIDMGLHVLAPDMPGFGASPACQTDIDSVLSDFFRTQGLEKAVLIGPSMGGRIAMEFAIAHPERVSALVLAGPVGVEENRAVLDRISAPVLLVWGEDDQVSPPALSQLLQDKVANLRLELYAQAPHPCYLAEPERWHRHLREFLTEHIV